MSEDRSIDGQNVLPIFSENEQAKSPQGAFYYYRYDRLQTRHSGKWKLHLFSLEIEAKRILGSP